MITPENRSKFTVLVAEKAHLTRRFAFSQHGAALDDTPQGIFSLDTLRGIFPLTSLQGIFIYDTLHGI